MFDDGGSRGRSGAVDDVENSRRESRSLGGPGEQVGGDRCDLRRLADDGTARGKCRGDLPGEQVEGKIPRRDAACDADRLADRYVPQVVAGESCAVCLFMLVAGGAGEET